MKKWIVILTAVFMLSACSFSVGFEGNNTEEQEEKELQLQVTQVDKDSGVTVENNETYQEIERLLKENPDWGYPNDFGLQVVDLITFEEGNVQLLMLAINQTGQPLKDISLNLTLGSTDGDMIMDNELVHIEEQIIGVIEDHSAVPVLLPLNEEQQAIFNTLTDENVVMELDNFDYETP
ncbi:membrane lipoprotein lipid attachment site-containing protein [Alkalihalobacillus trypoxylicola]|uniref:DUF5067 domain-containing protein n=1 Tax=Alkalihalobacillus trypoxylicola TaxID=519424 RepID=A0A161PW49_9BACI|nr:membrane lipoprotein lipid attachment site-containing protein [Alkalihalobacillus trypoxylicola]KYG26010.1 hypothetical protein AZF04_13060 [Alkalihalobacillus trypoxylicola]